MKRWMFHGHLGVGRGEWGWVGVGAFVNVCERFSICRWRVSIQIDAKCAQWRVQLLIVIMLFGIYHRGTNEHRFSYFLFFASECRYTYLFPFRVNSKIKTRLKKKRVINIVATKHLSLCGRGWGLNFISFLLKKKWTSSTIVPMKRETTLPWNKSNLVSLIWILMTIFRETERKER
jgi:hypothetical protein